MSFLRIVHLLSQTQLTGAEAHAVSLAESQIAGGDSVFLVSDRIHLPTRAAFEAHPVHSARGLRRWRMIWGFRRWLREQKIDVIHAHSRAAVRWGWWATRGLPTALVSTIHGRQHYSLGKRWFDLYGQRVIAVCQNLKNQLVRDFRFRPERIRVLGNPVEFPETTATASPRRWALVGRWTGPKGKRAHELLLLASELFRAHPELQLDVIGGQPADAGLATAKLFEALQEQFPQRLRVIPFQRELEEKLLEYGLILGAGRVAIAALGSGRPCFAFGEALTHGLITPANFEIARASNFGDMGLEKEDQPLNRELTLRQLKEFLQTPTAVPEDLVLNVRELFAADKVASEVRQIYLSAIFLKRFPRPIGTLMYHQVVPQPIETPHRIFVTTTTFESHLKALQEKGFTTVTFKDLSDFKNGRRPWSEFPPKPVILTFDDGYENNLTLAAPLLRRHHQRAVLFLLADARLQQNTWDEGAAPQVPLLKPSQRQELARGGVFEIGSHGFHHARLPQMSDSDALQELTASKAALEKELGLSVNAYAFTYGDIDERSAELARRAGYEYAINTDRGAIHPEEDPHSVFRVNVFPEDSAATIIKKASWWYRWRYRWSRGR